MFDRPRLKICGVTNKEDARLVGDLGADYCGILVDVDFSERSLDLRSAQETASATSAEVVILMCDPNLDAAISAVDAIGPYAIQLLSHETPAFIKELKTRTNIKVWKTIHLPPIAGQAEIKDYLAVGVDVLLVDSVDTSEGFARLGGTGKLADWRAAAEVIQEVNIPVFLAGGISPENVEQAVLEVRPQGIDLCSGVEAEKGKKDFNKMKALVANFQAALLKLN